MPKASKKSKSKKESSEESGGMSLDDAFGDDEDVEYAAPKPKKEKKRSEEQEEEDSDEESSPSLDTKTVSNDNMQVKQSKPIGKIKKGDVITINGTKLEVDSHYIFEDYKTTKEMIIELFDPKTDKDYQLRYFDDQVPATLKFYELKAIVYEELEIKKVEW